MNRIYRLIWNPSLAMYVPAPESGRGRRKVCGLRTLATLVLSAIALDASALPLGGQVAGGQGSIGQSGSAMTVNQQSPNLVINWQSFGIGATESVNFVQPGASAIALNRVLGSDMSQIYGRLTANGQVWLLNPNGVLFGGGAQVNVGGLVASTLNISDADFLAGKRTFTGNGGFVINKGLISAPDGGYVALLGGKVSNEGVIQARLGTVALGAGNQVTLDFAGDKLLNLQVDQAVLDALVQNKQLIRADGGTVLLSTRAANDLLATVVNNTGVIEARTIDTSKGTIKLLGGNVRVTGVLNAAAPSGGDGGFIETSGAQVRVGDAASVTTAAPAGKTGQWLVGETGNFTITPGAGGLSGDTLASQLATTNVTVVAKGETSNGDLHVNDRIDWNSANSLTLSAYRDVKLAKPITNSGTGDVNLRADNSGNCVSGAESCGKISFTPMAAISVNGGAVNLYYNPVGSNNPADANGNGPSYASPTDFSRYVTLRGGSVVNAWMLVNDVNQLQAIDTNRSGSYALGRDIDASTTAGWNSGAESGTGFIPLGSAASQSFTGAFDGLGHTITGLVIERGSGFDSVGTGLFAVNDGRISNVGLAGAGIIGHSAVGALVGRNHGFVSNSDSTGSVAGYQSIGGLVGFNDGVVTGSHSSAFISGPGQVGGLVGTNSGTVEKSYSTGAVRGLESVGGLIGSDRSGTVSDSYSTGDVFGIADDIGGLIGDSRDSSIMRSHATGDVSARNGSGIGGLIGYSSSSTIGDSHATGTVSGTGDSVGGLVGANDTSRIGSSYATGDVVGDSHVGGLVGLNGYSSIGSSYAMGNVTGGTNVGGLVGSFVNDSSIENSYATGDVRGIAAGGLAGYSWNSRIASSYANGKVSGPFSLPLGGLVGMSGGGNTIVNSYWDITTSGQTTSFGGTGLTDAQMKQKASFTGFDFVNTWGIDEGVSYPFLLAH